MSERNLSLTSECSPLALKLSRIFVAEQIYIHRVTFSFLLLAWQILLEEIKRYC